jgi:hypothetical protein
MRETKPAEPRLHPDTTKSIWAIGFICAAVVLVLAEFAKAGPAGNLIYQGLNTLFGWGYFILPATLVFAAAVLLLSHERRRLGMTSLGGGLLILSFLALIEIFSPGNGGWFGLVLGSLRSPFGPTAAAVINVFILAIAVLVTANVPLRFRRRTEGEEEEEEEIEPVVVLPPEAKPERSAGSSSKKGDNITVVEPEMKPAGVLKSKATFANYVPPPLSLLNSDTSKPTTGDHARKFWHPGRDGRDQRRSGRHALHIEAGGRCEALAHHGPEPGPRDVLGRTPDPH